MNRGSRSGICRTPAKKRTTRQWIEEFRTLIIFFLAILLLSWLHLGASPWERVLGLAHGQQLSSPRGTFLAFDHLTPQGEDVLNRNLFMTDGEATELVTVHGYGLWRFGILSILSFGLCLFATRSLLRIRLRSLFSGWSGRRLDRRIILLSSTLLGVGAGLLGYGNVGPTLFALAFFMTLISATKKNPVLLSVSRNLEFLELSRFFWAGWLLPIVLHSQSAYFNEFWWNSAGLFIGGGAAFLVGKSKTKPRQKQFAIRPLDEAWGRSFDLGCWEVLGLTTILGMSLLAGKSYLYGTVLVLGAFGWGRLAQSILLRLILWMSVDYGRRGSTFRILTGVWFLMPVVVGPFLEGFDQTALMIWLAGLVPLASSGRPWGSDRDSLFSPSDTLDKDIPGKRPIQRALLKDLTLKQQAAVLFMSLPPEMSAQLFSELGPEEVQAITLEITQLPSIAPELRGAVISHFLDPESLHCFENFHSFDQLERLCKERPTKVAQMLKQRYLMSIPKKERIARELLAPLSPLQQAAVIFMSLPPELSAQLFSDLEPAMVQSVTLEITQLPSIFPELRKTVVANFLDPVGCHYDSEVHSAGKLERLMKKKPRKVAKMMRERLLVNVPPFFDEEAGKLPKLRQAAVLVRALGSERARELYDFMQDDKSTVIAKAVSELSTIRSDTELGVIRELFSLRCFRAYDWGKGPTELKRLANERLHALANAISVYYLKNDLENDSSERKGRRQKKHYCAECLDVFNHGIGLRKHQRQTGHRGSEIVEVQ